MPSVHPTAPRPRHAGFVLPALSGLAALVGLSSPAAAQLPGSQPKTVADTVQYEPPEGTARPPAPDQRTGHVYVAFGVSANGPAGSIASTVASTYDMGTGVTGSGLIGIGIGRHGSFQIFGDGTYFTSPGSCISGCSGRSFSVGIGVTYHLAQGLAIDPWGSFGMAYRNSTILAALQANASQGPTNLAAGTVFTQRYQGLDIARIAFGGDYYPVPYFGIGPFVEADLGTNLWRNYIFQDVQITTPNGQIGYLDQHPLSAYAFFQIGVRVTFDPLRRHLARPAPVTTGAAPVPAVIAGDAPAPPGPEPPPSAAQVAPPPRM